MKKERKSVVDFCKQFEITIDQFYGREKINHSLCLGGLKSIPSGFNPNVAGFLHLENLLRVPKNFKPIVGTDLDLSSVRSLPPCFNPTVGGYLKLSSLKSLPIGFNALIGCSLFLGSLKTIPENFNPVVGGKLDIQGVKTIKEGFNPIVGDFFKNRAFPKILPSDWLEKYYENNWKQVKEWNKDGKNYIRVDDRFSEVIEKGSNFWKIKNIGQDREYYLVTDGKHFAHGDTIRKAKLDLAYKISAKKEYDKYKEIDKNKKFSFDYCVKMYRFITRGCERGINDFVSNNNLEGKKFSVYDIARITNGAYGSQKFLKYFDLNSND